MAVQAESKADDAAAAQDRADEAAAVAAEALVSAVDGKSNAEAEKAVAVKDELAKEAEIAAAAASKADALTKEAVTAAAVVASAAEDVTASQADSVVADAKAADAEAAALAEKATEADEKAAEAVEKAAKADTKANAKAKAKAEQEAAQAAEAASAAQDKATEANESASISKAGTLDLESAVAAQAALATTVEKKATEAEAVDAVEDAKAAQVEAAEASEGVKSATGAKAKAAAELLATIAKKRAKAAEKLVKETAQKSTDAAEEAADAKEEAEDAAEEDKDSKSKSKAAEGVADLPVGYSSKGSENSDDAKTLYAFLLMFVIAVVVGAFISLGFTVAVWRSAFISLVDGACDDDEPVETKESEEEGSSTVYLSFGTGSCGLVRMDGDQGYEFVTLKGDAPVDYSRDGKLQLVRPVVAADHTEVIYVRPKQAGVGVDPETGDMTDPEVLCSEDVWAYVVFWDGTEFERGILHAMGWHRVEPDMELQTYVDGLIPQQRKLTSGGVEKKATDVFAKLFHAYEPIMSSYPGESKLERSLFLSSDPVKASWNWYSIASGAIFVLATVCLIIGFV